MNRPTEKGMVKFQSVHCSSPHWALDFLDGSYSVPVNKASVMGRTLQESKELLNTTSDPLPSFSATVLRVFVQMSADHRHVIRHVLVGLVSVFFSNLSPYISLLHIKFQFCLCISVETTACLSHTNSHNLLNYFCSYYTKLTNICLVYMVKTKFYTSCSNRIELLVFHNLNCYVRILKNIKLLNHSCYM